MKKILALMMTIVMLVAIGVPVSADPATSVHLKDQDSLLSGDEIIRAIVDVTDDGPFEDDIVTYAYLKSDNGGVDLTEEELFAVDGIIKLNNGLYIVNLNRHNGINYTSSDFSQDITEVVEYFTIEGAPHSIARGDKEGDDIGEGNEGGGTINYWLNNLIQAHEVTITDNPDDTASWTGEGTYWTTSDAALTFEADFGHHIVDVTDNGESLGAITSHDIMNIQEDHAVIVYTERDDFTVEITYYDADDDSVLIPTSEVELKYEDSHTVTFETVDGYTQSYIEVDGTNEGNPASWTVTSIDHDVVIDVYLDINTYQVTIDSDPAGAIVEDGTNETWEWHDSDTVYFTVTDANTFVDDVHLNGVSKGSMTSYDIDMIEEDHAFVVTVKDIPEMEYEVIIDGEMGATWDNDGTYYEGATVVPTFGVMPGYQLDEVYRFAIDDPEDLPTNMIGLNAIGAVESDTLTNLDSHYYYFIETTKIHTITVIDSPDETALPEGSWTVLDGDSLSIEFEPIEGRAIVSIVRDSEEMGMTTIFDSSSGDYPILTSYVHDESVFWDNVEYGVYEDITFYVETVPLYDVTINLVGDAGSLASPATIGDVIVDGLGGTELDPFYFTAADHYDITDVTVAMNGEDAMSLEDDSMYDIEVLDGDYVITVYTEPETYDLEVKSMPEGKILEDGAEYTLTYMEDMTVDFTPIDPDWEIVDVVVEDGDGYSYPGAVGSFDVIDIDSDTEITVYLIKQGIIVDKDADDNSVNTGTSVTYTITVTNDGTESYPSVILTDDMNDDGTLEYDFDIVPLLGEADLNDNDMFDPGEVYVFQYSTSFSSNGDKYNVAVVEAYGYASEQDYEGPEEYELLDSDTDSETVNVSSRTVTRTRYTLTVNVEGEGTVDAEGRTTNLRGDYNMGQITPADGWELFAIEGRDGDDVEGPDGDGDYNINMNANKTVDVVFVREEIPQALPEGFTLTIVVEGEGNVESDVIPMGEGEVYRFPVLKGDDGWEFFAIGGPDQEDLILVGANRFNIVMDEDKEIHIVFIQEEMMEIIDEVTPEALPTTSGVPMAANGLLGTLVTGLGFYLRKRRR